MSAQARPLGVRITEVQGAGIGGNQQAEMRFPVHHHDMHLFPFDFTKALGQFMALNADIAFSHGRKDREKRMAGDEGG